MSRKHRSKLGKVATVYPPKKPAPTSPYCISSKSMTPTTSTIVRTSATAAPMVFYAPLVKAQMDYIIDRCTAEVGWLGLVDKVEGGYLVKKIYVPYQEVSAAETDISVATMIDLAEEIFASNEVTSQLYYWGHSHVNMSVNPSMQDEEQIEEYLEHCPLFIRGIYNKKGDSKVDVYDRDSNIIFQCVRNQVYCELPIDAKTRVDTILTANVKQRAFPTYVMDDASGKLIKDSRQADAERYAANFFESYDQFNIDL